MEVTRSRMERITISEIDLPVEPFKENDAQLFAKLKASIAKRGQLKTIVVCMNFEKSRYECLEGSKIVLAMKDLGHEAINAVMIENELTEDEKNQIRLELSRDYFLTNYVLIGKMLKKLSETEKLTELCQTIPFDVRQVENLIAMSDFDWEAFAQNKQIEGQISMFDALIFEENVYGDNEPDYSNVEVIETNPDYVEPVKIDPDLKPKDGVETMIETPKVDDQKERIFSINIHNTNKDDETVVRFGTPTDVEKDLFSVSDQLAQKFELDGHTQIQIPMSVVEEMKQDPETYEPILKDIAPELYEPSIIEEVIAEGTSKEEFEQLLDARPDAQKSIDIEPVPVPELLIDTDQPFYIDHRNVLVIKQHADAILMNLPSIAQSILIKKEYITKEHIFVKERLNISKQNEDEKLIVTHVIYVTEYDVKFNLQLKDICEVLTKIDFE